MNGRETHVPAGSAAAAAGRGHEHGWKIERRFGDGRWLWMCPGCGVRSIEGGAAWQGDPTERDGDFGSGFLSAVALLTMMVALGYALAGAVQARPGLAWVAIVLALAGAVLLRVAWVRGDRR